MSYFFKRVRVRVKVDGILDVVDDRLDILDDRLDIHDCVISAEYPYVVKILFTLSIASIRFSDPDSYIVVPIREFLFWPCRA